MRNTSAHVFSTKVRAYQAGEILTALVILFSLLVAGCTLPEGLNYRGTAYPTSDVHLLTDLTWINQTGDRQTEQHILDRILEIIHRSKRFILLDVFLFNEFQGPIREESRPIVRQLTDALIEQKQTYPDMTIIVITDPINTVYGNYVPQHLKQLQEAGIRVVITDLTRLRDSNIFYSPIWRLFIHPLGRRGFSLVPNPLDKNGNNISVVNFLELFNFKANHRKVIIADNGDCCTGLVASFNPHDASSAHDNVAVNFSGPAVADLLKTELAVIRFSSKQKINIVINPPPQESDVFLTVLTERQIKLTAIDMLDKAKPGDKVDLVMFYLSDRTIIKHLKKAKRRGVYIRVLLDPNKDAFGYRKNGIPNRPVASELHNAGITVRWALTHGEQHHTKMLLTQYADESAELLVGSANFTRRNLDNFNLETDVHLQGPVDSDIFRQAQNYFDLVWSGDNERQFSTDYEYYMNNSCLEGMLYLFQEETGMGTF